MGFIEFFICHHTVVFVANSHFSYKPLNLLHYALFRKHEHQTVCCLPMLTRPRNLPSARNLLVKPSRVASTTTNTPIRWGNSDATIGFAGMTERLTMFSSVSTRLRRLLDATSSRELWSLAPFAVLAPAISRPRDNIPTPKGSNQLNQ